MNKKRDFVAINITHKHRGDISTQVWATIEDGKIISLSDASGKLLKLTSFNTVIFNNEEYYFYQDVITKSK